MPGRIKTVAIIGAGTMGQGIAQVVAMAGYKVQLFDSKPGIVLDAISLIRGNLEKGIEKGKVQPEQLEKTLQNIAALQSFREIKAELVIEAVIEKLKVKQKLFDQLEDICSSRTIFCTNTSSIPVTKIAAGLKHANRLVGLHFFNPAHIMKLVEVISTGFTDKSKIVRTIEFVESIGKIAVVAKDAPGFIVNRVARHFYVESLKVLEENVARLEDIDKLMEATGFKLGPFKLMDLIGVDTNYAVTETIYNGFHQDPKFRPSRIQEALVMSGKFGRKSGEGFYAYK